MQFLDVKTDYAFKKVFGSDNSKVRLIKFLNAIIYKDEEIKIADLTIEDPYNIPLIKGMKDTFVDVKARLNNNKVVIIEMQVLNHNGFEKRVLYNAAKNYSVQLNKKDEYHLLNPVIALTIVDFMMFKDTEKYINRFKLLEKEEFISYSDDIELVFVELPKFKKELEELKEIQDEWIYFIQNAGSLEYIPQSFDNDIKDALECVNEANLTKKELEIQHKRKEFISIQKLAIMKANDDGFLKGRKEGMEQGREEGMEQGREQGREEGREQGREEGIEQEKIKIAKNLLDVLDDETISLKTGLTVKQINKLR